MINGIYLSSYFRYLTVALVLAVVLSLAGSARVSAHGGEDHGGEKPQTQTSAKGTVSRSVRVGDVEVTLKHSQLEPDTAVKGGLFVTKFETNEPVADAGPKVEVESPGGTVSEAPVEKTDTPGGYAVKIPALPEGTYVVRVTVVSGGKAGTATFSGVKVEHGASGAVASGASWSGYAWFFLAGLLVLGMFGGLIYFVWRLAGDEKVGDEAVTV